MARLKAPRPFPPGTYPAVIVGSGPGGLQLSYALRRLGVTHAVLSADTGPGGMFLRFPLFQRLITWSKPYPPTDRRGRPYEWYDWNSLLADTPALRGLVPRFMDGTSAFPSRAEMARGLVAFAERTGVRVRYRCRWEGTRRNTDGFVLTTSDGEYRCHIAIFAIGEAKPWKPPIPGLDLVPHYVETKAANHYKGKRVFIIGKRNSAFEVADALLPWARQLILASPRPALLSILSYSTAGVRARYLVPYEDHVLGGGTFTLDAAIESVEKTATGYRVHAKGSTAGGEWHFDVDEVIAATGFTAPLGDLPALGLATTGQTLVPALSPFWESTSVPGLYFAGSITHGAVGLRKHGIPSMSGGVAGFRHNARVLATHLARTHFAVEVPRPALEADAVVPYLLAEVSHAPELWNQRSYLARVVSFTQDRGIMDDGIVPLAHFVDSQGPNAVAVVVETDTTGDHHPAVYLRHAGHVSEHVLPSDPLLSFESARHETELRSLLAEFL